MQATSSTTVNVNANITQKIATDPLERLHISVLKWTLGLPNEPPMQVFGEIPVDTH